MPVIKFISLAFGYGLTLGKHLATTDCLCKLFGFDKGDSILIISQDGDQILVSQLEPDTLYTVTTEKEIENLNGIQDFEVLRSKPDTKRLERIKKARVNLINELYNRKHPNIFTLERSFFHPDFINAFTQSPDQAVLKQMIKETSTKIFSFSLFTDDFCDLLIEEIENFEMSGMPNVWPNTMNHYGVVLEEIGFSDFLLALRENYVKPLAEIIYPDFGKKIVEHHGFMVKYKLGEDANLAMHYDSSLITLNVCVGKEFTGGTLFFRGLLLDPSSCDEEFEYTHIKGKALLHLGGHYHGANNIQSGTRYNLILWCREMREQQSGALLFSEIFLISLLSVNPTK